MQDNNKKPIVIVQKPRDVKMEIESDLEASSESISIHENHTRILSSP